MKCTCLQEGSLLLCPAAAAAIACTVYVFVSLCSAKNDSRTQTTKALCAQNTDLLILMAVALQVGYGLFQDLKAVSTAIGSHGSGCIAVVHPFVDLRILSKQLWRKYPTQAPRVNPTVPTFLHFNSMPRDEEESLAVKWSTGLCSRANVTQRHMLHVLLQGVDWCVGMS